METEIEVKFISVDVEKVRETLRALGATCLQSMRMMRRVVIETPELASKNAFIRVRDEGDKITTTYKQFDEVSLTGAKEIELVISDFDAMIELYAQSGLPASSFMESQRETWELDDVEVVIDLWPHLEPYIEIEGHSEQAVMQTAERLGFDWGEAVFGKVTEVYQRQYPNGNADLLVDQPRIVFNEPLPQAISGEAQDAPASVAR